MMGTNNYQSPSPYYYSNSLLTAISYYGYSSSSNSDEGGSNAINRTAVTTSWQPLLPSLLATPVTPPTPPPKQRQQSQKKNGGQRRGGGGGGNHQNRNRSSQSHQRPASRRPSSSSGVNVRPSSSSVMASANTTTSMERAQELTSLLECPVCYSIPEGEVFNCERGHSVCSDCHKKLPKCAFCASPSTGGSRNFMAETLIGFFKKYSVPLEGRPCPNPLIASCEHKAEGCKVTALKSKIDEHSRTCEFRPIPCNLFRENCGFHPKFKLSEYFEHLKSFHKIVGQTDKDNRISGHFTKIDRLFMGIDITTTWPPFYLEYDGKVFVRHASILNRNIYWWIQLIGSDGDAKKYQATITLQSPVKVLKISWTIPVHPIRSGIHEIVRSKEMASMTTSKLLQFCTFNQPYEDKNSTHVWSFNIWLSKVV